MTPQGRVKYSFGELRAKRVFEKSDLATEARPCDLFAEQRFAVLLPSASATPI